MNVIERDTKITAVGYESLVWVNDNTGREFSCTLDTPRGAVKSIDELSSHERKSCMDVNQMVGTERW